MRNSTFTKLIKRIQNYEGKFPVPTFGVRFSSLMKRGGFEGKTADEKLGVPSII
jgi:hypothetical protein